MADLSVFCSLNVDSGDRCGSVCDGSYHSPLNKQDQDTYTSSRDQHYVLSLLEYCRAAG